MTTEITTQILQQIRTDIADLRGEVQGDMSSLRTEIRELRSEMNHRFEQVNDQFSAMLALMGRLVRNDQSHDERLTTLEAQTLLRGLRGLDFVGADLVEVSPPFDSGGVTALAGVSLIYEEICLLAEAITSRREG